MPRRHLSRECALQVLYLMDAGGAEPGTALRTYWADFPRDVDVRDYVEMLVNGVAAKRAGLDETIERRSLNWRMARMAIVDRNILRLAVYEMRFSPDVPAKVAIDEAIELAKKFGSEDSRAFVNGVLDGVLNDMTAPAPKPAPEPVKPPAPAAAKTAAVRPAKATGGESPPKKRAAARKPAVRKPAKKTKR
jgi:N utilization substance protein B